MACGSLLATALFLVEQDRTAHEIDVRDLDPQQLASTCPGEGCGAEQGIDPGLARIRHDVLQKRIDFLPPQIHALPELRGMSLGKAVCLDPPLDLGPGHE